MASEKRVAFTVEMTEAQADKLADIAGKRGITMQQCVIDWIEGNASSINLEESFAQLEHLAWMNLYWASLPFSDGVPKQRIKDEGLEQLWENASLWAAKYARPVKNEA